MIVLLAIGELLLYPSFSLTVCCFSRKQLSLYCKITSWCLILVHMKVVSYPVSSNNARREVTRSFGCMINPLADLQNFNPEVTGSLHGGVRPMEDISTNMTSATRWVRLQLSVCCNTYPLVTYSKLRKALANIKGAWWMWASAMVISCILVTHACIIHSPPTHLLTNPCYIVDKNRSVINNGTLRKVCTSCVQ